MYEILINDVFWFLEEKTSFRPKMGKMIKTGN